MPGAAPRRQRRARPDHPPGRRRGARRRARRRRARPMSTVTTTIDNFIGGAFAAPGEGATGDICKPATGEGMAVAPLSGAADVGAAVAAAAGAFDGWSSTPLGERALALLRIAGALEARGEEIAQVESLNVGKPIAAAR